MDFPSSKRLCSPAGQIRPQHAWLQTAAAHPQQLQPGGGKRPESIRGIHKHSLSQDWMSGRRTPSIAQMFKIINEQRQEFIRSPKNILQVWAILRGRIEVLNYY